MLCDGAEILTAFWQLHGKAQHDDERPGTFAAKTQAHARQTSQTEMPDQSMVHAHKQMPTHKPMPSVHASTNMQANTQTEIKQCQQLTVLLFSEGKHKLARRANDCRVFVGNCDV